MKIFLSYSILNRKLAAQLKDGLKKYGQEVFMAHEDINPSIKWKERILKELDICPVFVALLTENFRGSEWTDQETGIAIAKDKLIIPLMLKNEPHGFMSRNQALKIKEDDIESACFKIMETIVSEGRFTKKIKNDVIKSFGQSNS